MAFGAQDKGDLGLRANVRPGSVDPIAGQRLIFPLEAFEFSDANRSEYPELRMKQPWRLVADYITSSGAAFNALGNIKKVPDEAYFSGLRYTTSQALSIYNKDKEETIAPVAGYSVISVTTERASIAGLVQYDLSQMSDPDGSAWSGDYTIFVKGQSEGWNYLSSAGPALGTLITKDLDIITINSTNLLIEDLPFPLFGTEEWFQDVMIIPEAYTQFQIDTLLDNTDNFSMEDGTLSADRGFTLSPDGFYWYNGGQYISLGTEAEFQSVNMTSGDWDGLIIDGSIDTPGTTGWAISYEGDAEFNDGTFRGTIIVGSGNDLDTELANIEQQAVDAQADADTAISDAGTAQTTADSKNRTYYQDNPPTGTYVEGDLWIDTNDGNNQWRYTSGIWVDVQDTAIVTAQSDATQAIDDASDAQAAATAAQGTADGKNTIYVSTADPSDTYTMKAGDIWYDQNADTDIPAAKVGQKIWTGSAWTNSYSIKSQSFNSGSAGWAIWDNGDVEFNDGTFRGTLEAGEIKSSEVTSGAISDPNFVAGSSGWAIKSDGSAEFQDIDIRGDFQSFNIYNAKSTASLNSLNYTSLSTFNQLVTGIATNNGYVYSTGEEIIYNIANYTQYPTTVYVIYTFTPVSGEPRLYFYDRDMVQTKYLSGSSASAIGEAVNLQMYSEVSKIVLTNLPPSSPGLGGLWMDTSGYVRIGTTGGVIPR